MQKTGGSTLSISIETHLSYELGYSSSSSEHEPCSQRSSPRKPNANETLQMNTSRNRLACGSMGSLS